MLGTPIVICSVALSLILIVLRFYNVDLFVLKFDSTQLGNALHNLRQRDLLRDSIIPSLDAVVPNLHAVGPPGLTSIVASLSTQLATASVAVASALPSLEADLMPQNCSFGTLSFCVMYANATSCTDLPPSLAAIRMPNLPGVDTFVRDSFGPILTSQGTQILLRSLTSGLLVSAFVLPAMSLLYLMVQRRRLALRLLIALLYVCAATPALIVVAIPGFLLDRLPSWMSYALGSGYTAAVVSLGFVVLVAIAMLISRDAQIA